MTARTPDDLFRQFLRSGDPEPFAQLYDAMRPELLRTASRIAPTATSAEDLVQATFLGALESVGRFRRGGNVAAWLHGILKNQARLMRWRASRQPAAERLSWPAPDDPVEQAQQRELDATLALALARLGDVYAPVMQCHLRDELSAQDIAARIARPAGTVRTQIVRGTAMLRQMLPAGLATMLLIRLAPGAGANEVRAQLLERAAVGKPPVGFWRSLSAKQVVIGVGALVAVTIGSLAAIHWSAERIGAPATPQPIAFVNDIAHKLVASVGGEPLAFGNQRTPVHRIERTSLSVAVTSQGQPAIGVPVEVTSITDVRFDRYVRATDAHGLARFDDLAAGPYFVLPLRTGGERGEAVVRLEPDRATTHQVEVAEIAAVRGRAVDEGGFAIAGASLWLCDGDYRTSFGLGAVPFARTDASGYFSVPFDAMARLSHMLVTAEGRRASPIVALASGRGTELTLTLAEGGAAVTGIVLGADGAPCPGLMVRARHDGTGDRTVAVDSEGRTTSRDDIGAVHEVRTEPDGSFRIDGFTAGRSVLITAWGPEWCRHECVVVAGAAPITMSMRLASCLRGRVLTPAGAPAADAVVSMQGDDGKDPFQRGVRCDQDGRFVMRGLTAGAAVGVVARSESPPRGLGLGSTTLTLTMAAGLVYEWNATLVAGDGLAGVLVTSDGDPLADWRIEAWGVDLTTGQSLWTVKTDAQGRFHIGDLPQSRYLLSPRTRRGANVVSYFASWPLESDYRLVVDARLARAAVAPATRQQPLSLPLGRLDVAGLRPTDEISMRVFEHVQAALLDSPMWDLSSAVLLNSPAWHAERGCHTCELPPGRYRLALQSHAWATDALTTADHMIDFTIVAGAETTVRPVVEPGVRRTFRIEEPWSHLGARNAEAVVFDASGRFVMRYFVPRRFEPAPGTFEASAALAPGRYRIEVLTNIGQRGSVDFVVGALAPDETVVPLFVR